MSLRLGEYLLALLGLLYSSSSLEKAKGWLSFSLSFSWAESGEQDEWGLVMIFFFCFIDSAS